MNGSVSPQTLAGLYLHIPFCSAVCPYCDFAVQVAKPSVRAAYVRSLLDEVELWADWKRCIDTIYFGGGTPSLLQIDDLALIVETVRSKLPVVDVPKVFFEANPEDVTARELAAWRSLGVDVLSLGVQSFDDAELRWLGRRHSAKAAIEAVETALEAGFDTVSVDLIFGTPDQNLAAWRASLETVSAIQPQHISCYQLTVHDGTTFGRWRDRGKLFEMAEGAQAEIFDFTHEFLGRAGYAAYEVSNFARTDADQSRHNLKYWRHSPYLGLGPSAHSLLGNRRWWNHGRLGDYDAAIKAGQQPIAGDEYLTDAELALETVMLQLRTTAGIELDVFQRRFGYDLLERNLALVRSLEAQGCLTVANGRISPTVTGLAVADGMAARFDLA